MSDNRMFIKCAINFIAYESCCLQPQERSLGIYEKELLAVIHALDTWNHYLLGTPFIIRTDQQSIKYLMT